MADFDASDVGYRILRAGLESTNDKSDIPATLRDVHSDAPVGELGHYLGNCSQISGRHEIDA